jgi:hypothetical protein
MILDAFSSDAIPVHLLTREAFALYLDKLAPGGLIALHISNRNLDVAPVVATLLADAGLVGRVQTQAPPLDAQRAYRNAATWVAIAAARQTSARSPAINAGSACRPPPPISGQMISPI